MKFFVEIELLYNCDHVKNTKCSKDSCYFVHSNNPADKEHWCRGTNDINFAKDDIPCAIDYNNYVYTI